MISQVCNICGDTREQTKTKRLVRDHDHTSGLIRGMLCDLCNAWVRIYESGMAKASFLKDWLQYYLWVYYFKEKIDNHIKTSTGVLYHEGKGRKAFRRRYS